MNCDLSGIDNDHVLQSAIQRKSVFVTLNRDSDMGTYSINISGNKQNY